MSADIVLCECVSGACVDGESIAQPGVGDITDAVLIIEGVRGGECLVFNEVTKDGDGPRGVVIKVGDEESV